MTREQLKDAVVAAARVQHEVYGAHSGLIAALAALDAHPAQEVVTGETVEVRAVVILWGDDGREWIVRGDDRWGEQRMREEALHRGRSHPVMITARVPLPVVPTVTATVTLPLDREGGR